MEKTAKERAEESSGVTSEMVDAAEYVLTSLGVKRFSKSFSNRDIIYEILRAGVAVTRTPIHEEVLGGVTKDEEGWTTFFSECRVIVNDPEVGKQLLKVGLESAEAFGALVETIAQNKAVVVPLMSYPGVVLFKAHKPKRARSTIETPSVLVCPLCGEPSEDGKEHQECVGREAAEGGKGE